MPEKKPPTVTIRMRFGESEFEVTGPSDYVEKKIADFMKQHQENKQPSESPKVSETKSVKAPSKAMSPAQFFRKVKPSSDVQRVLFAAYYLEFQKKQENFASSEIRELLREAKIPPPRNTSDAINQNVRKGFIMSAGDKEGKMAFVLTTDGEDEMMEVLKDKES
jgi:hypothetical protein